MEVTEKPDTGLNQTPCNVQMEMSSNGLNEGAKEEGGIRIPFMYTGQETSWMEIPLKILQEIDKTDVRVERRTGRIKRENRAVIAYAMRC